MDMFKNGFVHGHVPRAAGWGSVKETPVHLSLKVEKFESRVVETCKYFNLLTFKILQDLIFKFG